MKASCRSTGRHASLLLHLHSGADYKLSFEKLQLICFKSETDASR